MTRITCHLGGLAILTAAALALTGCGTDPGYEETDANVRGPADTAVTTDRAQAETPPAPVPEVAPAREVQEPAVSELASAGDTSAEAPDAEGAPIVEPAEDPHQAFLDAEALFAKGDRERAIPLLRASIAARDGFVHAHYLLGLSLRKTGALEEAETSLRRALELQPSHVRARTNLARVLIDTGRPAEAIDSLSVAFENGSEGTDLWNVRGLAHLTLGELDAAAADFENAVRVGPDNVYALNNLGLTEIRRGRFESAVGPLQRAAASDAAPGYVFNNLGIALERSGALAQAVEAYDEAIARGHGHAAVSLARVEATVPEPDEVESLAALPGDSPESVEP